jgi:uncharacterized RDD family membrane protein YckC
MEKTFLVTNDLLATSGKRFINGLVDMIISRLIAMLLLVVFGLSIELVGMNSEAYFDSLEDINSFLDWLITAILSVPYFIVMEITTGKTIGKYLTGTIVVDIYGNQPKKSDILKRSFARYIPFDAISFLGTIPRGWHDTMSDTYVVEEKTLNLAKTSFENLEMLGKNEEEMV